LNIKKFSAKQIFVLTWWYKYNNNSIICDGAIRTGKTLCLSISFVLWAFYNFNKNSFVFASKTIKTCKRNIISQILPILNNSGFKYKYKFSENILEIYYKNKINYFYIFGGKDESSASLIQGMTLSGVLFDEVVLMPRNFVEQALARCSVQNSRFWFSCNPESPSHWFYQNWISQAKNKNIILVKFNLEDNPGLSKQVIKKYHEIYTGNFYERFILGKWCYYTGLVYKFMTDNNLYISRSNLIDKNFSNFAISCDYGIINPFSCGLWGKLNNIWYRIQEYYFDSKLEDETKTEQEHFQELIKLINNRKIDFITVDPSASGFITLLKKNNFKIIKNNNNILEGINSVTEALKLGKIKICDNCHDTIREFSLYKWKDSSRDLPIKKHDHAMDDIRYFVTSLEKNSQNNNFFVMSIRRS
jgi:PBSX family phage terminase large subunit